MIFRKKLKFPFRVYICTFVALLFLTSCEPKISAIQKRPVARVDNLTLTADEFSERLAQRLKVFNDLSAKDSVIISQAKGAVVQDFIVDAVTSIWAKDNQIFVRKEQVDEEVLRIRKSYPDDISFRKSLADEGLIYDQWLEKIKTILLSKLVIAELKKKIPSPTTDQLKSVYNESKKEFEIPAAVRLRQVVLDTDINAMKIKKELARGRSLAELAKKFSLAPEGQNGGDTGWIEKGTLEVFDSAFKLGVGARSGILKSPYGFHIYEVLQKRNAKTLSFEEAKSKIVDKWNSMNEQELYSRWLEEQVLRAKVFKDDELISKIEVQTRSLR